MVGTHGSILKFLTVYFLYAAVKIGSLITSGSAQSLSSSCGGTVQTGGSCTLTCTTSLIAVAWERGGYTQERSYNCWTTSPSLPTGYTSTCNSSSYSITFTNARYDRDSRTWMCRSAFGGSDSNEIKIDVKVPLISVNLTRTSSTVTCTATSNPRPSIALYRGEFNVSTSPAATEGNDGWTATVNFQLTGASRNYVHWCRASNSETSVNSTFSYPQIAVVTVTLRNITNNNQAVGAAEDESLTLTCVTSASYPAGSVTWYKNNVKLTSEVASRSEVTSGVVIVTTSTVTLGPLTKSDQGHQVYCTATNQYTSLQVQSKTARLAVWYGPEEVDITLPANTLAIENRDVTLTCTVTAYPAPTFNWSYSDGTTTGGSTGSVTSVSGSTSRWAQKLTFRPDRNRPAVRCRATNTQTSASRDGNKTLDVKYSPQEPPSITNFTSIMFEGDLKTIACSVTGGNPLGDITWTCTGTGAAVTRTFSQTRTLTLTFTVAKNQNGQQCRCQGSWQYGGYSLSDVKTFNVSYPPSKPVVAVPAVVCEGQPVSSLGCSSSDPGNPTATYTWTKNDQPVSPGFSPVRTDNGAMVRCSAGNLFTARPGHTVLQSDSKTITVHYAPHITTNLQTNIRMKEGESLSVTCVSDSNPTSNVSDIRWMYDGIEAQGPELQKTNISRQDDGVYVCKATINSGSCGILNGHKNITVVVNYSPDVYFTAVSSTEGQPLQLACQAEGQPATYNFRSFTQHWGDTEIQTRFGQQTFDTYRLRIDAASYLDSGLYECSVDNTVTDRNNVLLQRRKINVNVRSIPKFTKDSNILFVGEIGTSVSIYQTIYSNENITYNWTHAGKTSTTKKTNDLSITTVMVNVYDKIVRTEGWKVSMTISTFQKEDDGLYIATVCNSVGCNSSTVNLTTAGPPWIPLDFTVINTTETSVLLRWRPNYTGGHFTQVFIIQYRKTGQTQWSSSVKEDTNHANGRYVYAEVTGLDSQTGYEFRVRAKSNRHKDNESPFTETTTGQTLGKQPSQKSNNAGIIAGSIVGGLSMCLIVSAVIVLYKRGYRCAIFKKVNDTEDKRNRDYQETDNTAYSTIEHIGALQRSTYASLENIQDQQYTELKLYENTKGGPEVNATKASTYENVKEHPQASRETVGVDTYENTAARNDHPYGNTSKT